MQTHYSKSARMEIFQKYAVMYLYFLWVYFSPTYPLVLVTGFFVICDTITGIYAAKKRGEQFTSKELRRIFPKFSAYGIAILVAHVVEKHYLPNFPAMRIISALVAYTELKSIDENIKTITGVSIFKSVIEQLQKITKR